MRLLMESDCGEIDIEECKGEMAARDGLLAGELHASNMRLLNISRLREQNYKLGVRGQTRRSTPILLDGGRPTSDHYPRQTTKVSAESYTHGSGDIRRGNRTLY